MQVNFVSLNKSQYKIVVDQPGMPKADKPVLAVMTHYQGTGCWSVEDLRLYPLIGLQKGRYFGGSAEDFHSSFTPETSEELALALSLIREPVTITPPDGRVGLHWCTFRGILRGKTAGEICGRASFRTIDWPTMHEFKDAMAAMRAIEAFWLAHDLEAGDPQLCRKISQVKLDNPDLQINQSRLTSEIIMHRMKTNPQNPEEEELIKFQEFAQTWNGQSVLDIPQALLDHYPDFLKNGAILSSVPESDRETAKGPKLPLSETNSCATSQESASIVAIDIQGQALVEITKIWHYEDVDVTNFRVMSLSEARKTLERLRKEATEFLANEDAGEALDAQQEHDRA